jgi:hypothetical protein
MNLSNLVLLITALFIAWQAWETRRLAELTRIGDQPLLDIEFQNNGAEISMKNIGRSPAYSPSIAPLKISDNEYFDFDPLHNSRSSILPDETRKVWMHHRRITETSIGGFLESVPALRNIITQRRESAPLKMNLQYFDKNGVRLSRILYIKISGNQIAGSQHIYTSTTEAL